MPLEIVTHAAPCRKVPVTFTVGLTNQTNITKAGSMSIISNIAAIDRKFAWSFFGFVLAVFFGGITIYNEFIRNPNPSLSVQILSDTNVLDVRENVPELKIVYGDVDIKSLSQTLSVVVFREGLNKADSQASRAHQIGL